MLKKTFAVAAMTAMTLFAAQASAAPSERTIEEVYKQCGLGGAIFGSSSAILAIISNVTWDLGTTAAISNSMSPETCVKANLKSAVFIKETFPSLVQDLAAGQGDHYTALNTLMNCATLSQNVRTQYAAYTQTAAYQQADQAAQANQMFNIVNQTVASDACASS